MYENNRVPLMVTLLWVTVLAELFDEKSLNMFYIQGHKNSAVVWQEKKIYNYLNVSLV